jgi:hypothetical protein
MRGVRKIENTLCCRRRQLSETGEAMDNFPGRYHVPRVKSESKNNILKLGRVLS